MQKETFNKAKELEKRISGLKIRQRVILKDQTEMRLFKEDAIKNIQNLKRRKRERKKQIFSLFLKLCYFKNIFLLFYVIYHIQTNEDKIYVIQ